jgi:hypothetical protein
MTRHSGNTCQQRGDQTRLRSQAEVRKQALKGSKGQNTIRVTHAKRTARAESPTTFAKRSASAQASSDSSVRDDAAMTEDGSPPFEVATGMRRQVSDTRRQLRSSRRIDLKSSGRPDENSEYETSSEVEHSAGPRRKCTRVARASKESMGAQAAVATRVKTRPRGARGKAPQPARNTCVKKHVNQRRYYEDEPMLDE